MMHVGVYEDMGDVQHIGVFNINSKASINLLPHMPYQDFSMEKSRTLQHLVLPYMVKICITGCLF